jgi:hypothetical protein
VRGYDKVEEYDPIERLRRLEGASRGGGGGGPGPGGGGGPNSSGGASGGRAAGGAAAAPGAGGGMRSLEEELAELTAAVNIRDFDYKPVPRPADE